MQTQHFSAQRRFDYRRLVAVFDSLWDLAAKRAGVRA